MNKSKSLTFRERVANIIGGDLRQNEVKKIEQFGELLRRARDYAYSPETVIQQLSEVDSQLLDLLMRQRGLVPLLGERGAGMAWTETDRRAAVSDSRYMYHYDVMTARAINLWTNFGFGQHVRVVPKDEQLQEAWSEFFNARRNRPILGQRKIHQLSNILLRDGEYFLVYYVSTLDGEITLRRLSTDQIAEIIHEAGDPDIPLYYVQNAPVTVGGRTYGAVYYADWQATPEQLEKVTIPEGAIRADDLRENTRVVVQQVALDGEGGRGWPQMYRALDWARAYRNFLQDRASVAAAVAMYVDKLKVQGNQRAVDAVISSLQSTLTQANSLGALDRNPPPAAGSNWVENGSITRERMPLTTGAGDAQTDGMTIAAQFASGSDVPLHFLNRPDAMQNRAVARESGLPWYETIQRYQAFWVDVFADMVEIVGRMANEYGQASIDDFAAVITLDSPFEADVTETVALISAVSQAVGVGSLNGSVGQRVNERLLNLALTALGARDAETLTTPTPAATPTPASDAGLPEAALKAVKNFYAGRITDQQLSEYLKLEHAEIAERAKVGANGNGHRH